MHLAELKNIDKIVTELLIWIKNRDYYSEELKLIISAVNRKSKTLDINSECVNIFVKLISSDNTSATELKNNLIAMSSISIRNYSQIIEQFNN